MACQPSREFVNVAAASVEGIDLETGYRSNLDLLGGGDETVALRVLASWLLGRSDTNSSGQTNEFAGSVGALPYADFKATASFNYRNGPFSGTSQKSSDQPSKCGVTRPRSVVIT